MTKQEIYKKCLKQWGFASQLDMVVEECAELIVAIQHFRRDRKAVLKVIEEIADVEIMCEQLRIAMGDQQIDAAKEKKLERLEKLLNKS